MTRFGYIQAPAPTEKKIVYIIGTYPELSKTFIDREILEAKRAGLNVTVLAVRPSKTGRFSPAVQRLIREIIYLVPVSPNRLIGAHFYYLLRHFRKYTQTLIYVLTRIHPNFGARIKTLLHFGAGVLAADTLRKARIADHIHAHFADGAAVIALVTSRLLEIPYSLTAHAFDIYREPVFLKEKIEGARFVTTCTAFNKSHLERETGYPVQLIYHGLDFVTIDEMSASISRPTPPLMLSVGRLQEKKGFAYLIEACALLKERGQKFHCEIVGDGPIKTTLSALIQSLELEDIVTLCGALPNADVLHKYSRATAFVLPCCITEDGDRDGIPNVILEAMAFGLPVISTDVSGIPEVIHSGETGLLVEPRSAEKLGAAMAWVLTEREAAAELGRRSSEFVRREFDIRKNVGRMIELLGS